MPPSPNATPSLRDLYRTIFRRKRTVISVFLLIFGSAAIYTLFVPREYQSECRLLLRLGRENLTLDPAATLGQDPGISVPPSPSRENELNSVVEMLTSRALAEHVVATVSAEAILNQQASAGPDSVNSSSLARAMANVAENVQSTAVQAGAWLRSINGSTPLTPRDRALDAFEQHLSVWPVRKSNVIRVAYEGRTPQLAQDVVAELVEAYLQQSTGLYRPGKTYEFLTKQTSELHDTLAAKEDELRQLKNQTGVVSPTSQREALIARISRLEDEVYEAASAGMAAEKRVELLQNKLTVLPQQRVISRTEGIADEGTNLIRNRLFELRVQEEEAAAKYQETHPQLQQIRQQVAEAQRLLAGEKRTQEHVTTAPGPLYDKAEAELLNEEPVMQSLQAKAAVLRQQLAEARLQLQTINDNELQIAKLQREIELLDTSYRKYCVSLEQARIDEALQRERLSNVALMQPPTYHPKPIRPKVLINLMLGLIGATVGSIALALLLEFRDHSLQTPEDVERHLDVPTLTSIPVLRRKELVLNGRH